MHPIHFSPTPARLNVAPYIRSFSHHLATVRILLPSNVIRHAFPQAIGIATGMTGGGTGTGTDHAADGVKGEGRHHTDRMHTRQMSLPATC